VIDRLIEAGREVDRAGEGGRREGARIRERRRERGRENRGDLYGARASTTGPHSTFCVAAAFKCGLFGELSLSIRSIYMAGIHDASTPARTHMLVILLRRGGAGRAAARRRVAAAAAGGGAWHRGEVGVGAEAGEGLVEGGVEPRHGLVRELPLAAAPSVSKVCKM
jgi:hypothetical protein